MKVKFEKSIDIIIEHEGGYICNPNDPGGETKYGISKNSYPNIDILNLTLEEAAEIYKRDFWDKMHLGELEYQDLSTEILDFGVNAGISNAGKYLQMCYNLLQEVAAPNENKLEEDGIVGSKTISSINAIINKRWGAALLTTYRALEVFFYLKLDINKKQHFLLGWLNRV